MIKLNEYWHVPEIDFISEKVKNSNEESNYEMVFRKFVKENHPNKNVMIDIGANIGIYSRSCSSFFKEVHAFEPVEKIFNCLKKNTENCNNVFLYKCGIGTRETDARFLYNKKNCGNTKQITESNITNENIFLSEIYPLNTFKFDDVNYIKIDVEGFEIQVLKNSKEIIERFMPWIQVEVNTDLAEIQNVIKSFGNFDIIDLKNKHNKLFVPTTGKNILI